MHQSDVLDAFYVYSRRCYGANIDPHCRGCTTTSRSDRDCSRNERPTGETKAPKGPNSWPSTVPIRGSMLGCLNIHQVCVSLLIFCYGSISSTTQPRKCDLYPSHFLHFTRYHSNYLYRHLEMTFQRCSPCSLVSRTSKGGFSLSKFHLPCFTIEYGPEKTASRVTIATEPVRSGISASTCMYGE